MLWHCVSPWSISIRKWWLCYDIVFLPAALALGSGGYVTVFLPAALALGSISIRKWWLCDCVSPCSHPLLLHCHLPGGSSQDKQWWKKNKHKVSVYKGRKGHEGESWTLTWLFNYRHHHAMALTMVDISLEYAVSLLPWSLWSSEPCIFVMLNSKHSSLKATFLRLACAHSLKQLCCIHFVLKSFSSISPSLPFQFVRTCINFSALLVSTGSAAHQLCQEYSRGGEENC